MLGATVTELPLMIRVHADRDWPSTRRDKEYEDDGPTRRIHFAMDRTGRNGDEISAPNSDSPPAIGAVVESKCPLHAEAGYTETPVMMPPHPGASWNPEHACRAVRQKPRFNSSEAPPLSEGSPRRSQVRSPIRKPTDGVEPDKPTRFEPSPGLQAAREIGGVRTSESIRYVPPAHSRRARPEVTRTLVGRIRGQSHLYAFGRAAYPISRRNRKRVKRMTSPSKT